LQKKASLEFKERMHLYLETSPAVGRALDALERMMKRKSREVFRKFALCLAKALLRSNDTAVSLLVTRAIDNMIPQLTETWLDDVDHAVNGNTASSASASPSSATPYTPSSPLINNTSLMQTPQLSAASRAVDPKDKPSAIPANNYLDNNNNSFDTTAADNEANEEDNVGLSRAFSGVLNDVRKMNDVKKNLARVDVSRYVTKFWGYIMKEIDAMVADLKISVKKVQRDTIASGGIDADVDVTDGTRAQSVILLAQQNSSTDNAIESSDSLLKEIGQAFADDDSAVDLVFTNVAAGFEERVRERVRNMTSDCSNTLRSYFERHLFHSDRGAGATRHFTTKKALEDAYRKAHTGGLLLLAALTVFRGRYYPPIDISSVFENQNSSLDQGREDSPMTFHSNNNDENGNNSTNNRSSSPSQQQMQVHQEVFLLHFTRAMEAFHVKYNLDQDQIAASRRQNDDGSNSTNTTSTSSSNTTTTTTSSSSSGSLSVTNSIVKSFEFPSLPSTEGPNDAVVATVDPGVKALHEFNERFVMLTKAAFRHAFDMFQQSCSFTYQLQSRQLERDAVSGAPTWMIFVLVFFVAREMMYILSDPILLIICIVVAYLFFKEWIKGQYLKFIETGPVAVTVPLKIGVDKALEVVHNLTGDNNKSKKE
jgi:hypothetical protein